MPSWSEQTVQSDMEKGAIDLSPGTGVSSTVLI